jgi:hypothetical protein
MSSELSKSAGRSFQLLSVDKPELLGHCVQFYERDFHLAQNIAYLVTKTLAAGDSSVLIATQAHLAAIEAHLAASLSDLNRFRETGRLLTLDALETLDQVTIGGFPDKNKFEAVIGGVIGDAAKNSAEGFVLGFGEMVALLCARNHPDATLYLEQLWNSLVRRYRLSLCCAYPLDLFEADPNARALPQICSEHSLVIPAETLV